MNDRADIITPAEFKKRLEDLCLKRGGGGMPRKRRDQHILFKSIVLTLDDSRAYGEAQLNSRIENWLERVGREIQIDHVTLRRHLVDEGYLERDPAGESYRLVSGARAEMFDPEVLQMNPHDIVAESLRERDDRKRRYMAMRGLTDNGDGSSSPA